MTPLGNPIFLMPAPAMLSIEISGLRIYKTGKSLRQNLTEILREGKSMQKFAIFERILGSHGELGEIRRQIPIYYNVKPWTLML